MYNNLSILKYLKKNESIILFYMFKLFIYVVPVLKTLTLNFDVLKKMLKHYVILVIQNFELCSS